MTQPTYAQYKNLTSSTVLNPTTGAGMINESIWERILTCFAVLASGQNPDASTYTP
jgi:hypothetical protein